MAPQHLQQQDIYHERLLSDRLDALNPFNWGVIRAEIDKKALGSGQVQLATFDAVMPDGVVLSLTTAHPELPGARVIGEHFPPTARRLDVFVGLPEEREGVDNFAEDESAQVRYRPSKRVVHDLAGSGSTAEVMFARRRPVLVLGNESRAGLVCFKVLEIVRDDTNSLVVSEPYIPPCLRIDASPFLVAALRRLLGAMVQRHKQLSEARSQVSRSSVEFSAKDVTRFLLLSAINAYIPVFSHMIESGHFSPNQCYVTLSQLAGQLTTFSAEISPTDLPRFVYTDLRGTFEELFARLIALLQATVEDHYVSIALTSRADGTYVANLNEERFWGCKQFLIAVKTDLPEGPTATQLPRLSKMASQVEINSILSAATPGAAVEVTYRPPPEIPVKAGLVYFTIATDNAYWRGIAAERTVALYLPALFNPSTTQVQLLGVLSGHK
ncbi:MAG: hypothetical protein RL701_383 [Pseudomonadota bacterium]